MIIAILQARMSSQRLPGKVLRPLCGVPMLLYQYRRVQDARMIDNILVATSIDKTDDPIRHLCAQERVMCFSGSLTDVLDRFYWLAQLIRPHHIVRLTGDCPMINPEVIDATIQTHLTGGFDYTRATMECGWPDGYDTEVMTLQALSRAWKGTTEPYDREHVTPYFSKHPEMFKIGEYRNHERDLSGLKLSVDTEDDFERVERILRICQEHNL